MIYITYWPCTGVSWPYKLLPDYCYFFYTNMYFMLLSWYSLSKPVSFTCTGQYVWCTNRMCCTNEYTLYITCTVHVPTFTKAEWRYMLCGIITAPTIPTACKTIKHTWKTNCNGDGTCHWPLFFSLILYRNVWWCHCLV